MLSLHPSAQILLDTTEDFLAASYGNAGEFQSFKKKRQTVQDAAWEAAKNSTDKDERKAFFRIFTIAEAHKGFTAAAQQLISREWPEAKAVMLANAMAPTPTPNKVMASAMSLVEGKRDSSPVPSANSIKKNADYWDVRFDGEEKKIQAKGNKGFGYIVCLLRSPCRGLSGADLFGNCDRNSFQSRRPTYSNAINSKDLPPGKRIECDEAVTSCFSNGVPAKSLSFQETCDDEALKAYKRKVDDLIDFRDLAERNGDGISQENYQSQINAILKHVQESKGLNGQQRNLQPPSAESRAYGATKRSIGRTLERLETNSFPALGKYLRATIDFNKPQITFNPHLDALHPDISWDV